ncbi:hypothetical protein [Nocardiopsis coralliicola]
MAAPPPPPPPPPAGTPPPPPPPPEPGAGAKPATRRRNLLIAGAVLLLIAAGAGAAAAGAGALPGFGADEDGGSPGGAGSAAASGDPSGSPDAEPSSADGGGGAAQQDVAYRNVRLQIPDDWEVRTAEVDFRSPGGPPVAAEEWTALIPDPAACEGEVDYTNDTPGACPHVKLLGPGGIGMASHGAELSPDGPAVPYDPSTNPMPCPAGVPTQAASITDGAGPGSYDTQPFGDRTAAYLAGPSLCLDEENPTAEDGSVGVLSYEQRYWFLPESEVLVVDNYGVDGLDDILAAAEVA